MAKNFKIGVMVESFRSGLGGGLDAAASLGADGVQIYASAGETEYSKMGSVQRRELLGLLKDRNLELSALCADFGGHGFQVESENPGRIEKSRHVMEMACELGCRVLTTHIGVIPPDSKHPRYLVMAKACEKLGHYAKESGIVLAIETGPEPASVLRSFLDDISMPGALGVNFDPANLVMVCREDIPSAVEKLGPYIAHTHAKDGLNLKPVDAEVLYGSFSGEVFPDFSCQDYIRETPLGEGGVPFKEYLAALRKSGFAGYLTIEREVGESPQRDIELAVNFLRKLIL